MEHEVQQLAEKVKSEFLFAQRLPSFLCNSNKRIS